MRGRQLLVDLLDNVHRQNLAIRLFGELVSAVARPDGDRKGVHPGPLHELDRLIRVGEAHHARAVAVLDAAERAELAFDGYAPCMGHLYDLARNLHIVVEARGALAVSL